MYLRSVFLNARLPERGLPVRKTDLVCMNCFRLFQGADCGIIVLIGTLFTLVMCPVLVLFMLISFIHLTLPVPFNWSTQERFSVNFTVPWEVMPDVKRPFNNV